MTLAICFSCGSQKFGALVPCDCGAQPQTRQEQAAAMLLCEWNMPVAELLEVSAWLKAGKPLPEIDQETLDALIPPREEIERLPGAQSFAND